MVNPVVKVEDSAVFLKVTDAHVLFKFQQAFLMHDAFNALTFKSKFESLYLREEQY